LFCEIGAFLFGRKDGRALQFAMQMMAQPGAIERVPDSRLTVFAQPALPLNPSIENEWAYAWQ
jgi:hypothetical protein